MHKQVYVCEDSVDGIFTAIYDAWNSKKGYRNIEIKERQCYMELQLFSEYIEVGVDLEKSEKVARSIRQKISGDAYAMVIRSALSGREGRADAIYRFLLLGFGTGSGIVEMINHPYVQPIFEMDRRVGNEAHHYLGFLRFSELETGILFASIRPENAIIPLIAPHFEERLPQEDWVIYDEGRNRAALHRKGYPYILSEGNELDRKQTESYSHSEQDIQSFWKAFVDAIGIEGRRNTKLQYQMLPNRYREFMPEMKH